MRRMTPSGSVHTWQPIHATRLLRALSSTSSSSRTSIRTGKQPEQTPRNPQPSSSIYATMLILVNALAIRRMLSLTELMKVEIVKCSPPMHHKLRLPKRSQDRALTTRIASNVALESGELVVMIAPLTAIACFNLLSMSSATRMPRGTPRTSSQLQWLLMTMKRILAPFMFSSNTPQAALSSTSNQC